MSGELPAFPERISFAPEIRGSWHYERALRQAWEARARKAVWMLDLISDEHSECSDEQKHWVKEALALIGPLPAESL